ncbi:glycosyltransferase family 39 protein [Candidatus Wolfebacteria bacterium]|nr:glycosyltransferase family 39 protein [Candidatus Wolfebacteria bacterium]
MNLMDKYNKFLSSKYSTWLILIIIILISFLLMFFASLDESITLDEVVHIPAGYSYIKYFDYRLNPEHPPLIKALSALPLLFQKINFSLENKYWREEPVNQWSFGSAFFYESGNDAQKILRLARIAPMFLMLLLIFAVYVWSKELVGRWWGILPAFLVAFSPNFLAHGHHVTFDVGATFGIFITLYFFVKFLVGQSNRYLIFSGLTFGIAQLMKFSAFILVPIFVCLLVVQRFFFGNRINSFKKLFFIFLIGFSLVCAVYFLFTFNYPISKQIFYTQTALGFLNKTGTNANFENCSKINYQEDAKLWMKCSLKKNLLKMSANQFARPFEEYFISVWGVFRQSRLQHEPNYFNGEICDCGRWYYFPEIFFLKEPLSSIIMIFIVFVFSFWNIIKNFRINLVNFLKNIAIFSEIHFAEFTMIFFVIIYGIYSITSGMNMGIRHILPIVPFIYILTTIGLKKISFSFKREIIFILVVLYALETFFVFPYFLSYFNQFGGGVFNGYNYAVHSNYDWGQDLKRLGDWVNKNNINKISVSYYGATTLGLTYYVGGEVENWEVFPGNPKSRGIDWFAVSVHLLKTHPEKYLWLKDIKDLDYPDYKAGTSIFIYKL